MIHWVWLFPIFIIGVILGLLIAALMVANEPREIKQERRR